MYIGSVKYTVKLEMFTQQCNGNTASSCFGNSNTVDPNL